MPGLLLQFAGSLAAVALLVFGAYRLGFVREARLAGEEEARDIAGLAPRGFEPVALALDRDGRGALLRDAAGRIVLLAPHGAHFVVRELDPPARAQAHGGMLSLMCERHTTSLVSLDLGDSAPDWAARISALG